MDPFVRIRDGRRQPDPRTESLGHPMRRRVNLFGLTCVRLGQLVLGAMLQVTLIVLGRQSLALYVLAGVLMGWGAFGVSSGVMTKPGTQIRKTTLLASSSLFVVMLAVAMSLWRMTTT